MDLQGTKYLGQKKIIIIIINNINIIIIIIIIRSTYKKSKISYTVLQTDVELEGSIFFLDIFFFKN